MKLYVHKHIAFDQETWEVIKQYMNRLKIDNFTELVKVSLLTQINSIPKN